MDSKKRIQIIPVIRNSRKLFSQMINDPDNKELRASYITTVRAESNWNDKKTGSHYPCQKNSK